MNWSAHQIALIRAPRNSFVLEPNLFVMLCTRLDNGRYPMEEIIELWPKKTKNLGVYDYFSTWAWGQDRLRNPGAYVPAASPSTIIAHMRRFHDLGYRFFAPESSANFGIYGPGYYVAMRGMWDLDADPNALMTDFLTNSFGPAADTMREFYELMDPASGRMMHWNTYSRLGQLLDKASGEVQGHPDVAKRLDQLKLYFIAEYLQFRRTDGSGDDAQAKEFAFRVPVPT